MKDGNLYTKDGLITENFLEELQKLATDVSCQCPGQLIVLLRAVQSFTEYQRNCLHQSPQDEVIHKWLESTSVNLEHIVSNTIVTLARMEGMLDDNNNLRTNDEEV